MKTPLKSLSLVFRTALVVGMLLGAVTSRAQNGTWTNLINGSASGSWGAATNWNNSILAAGSGNTAYFNTLDLTNTTTVTLDGARTIGILLIGDFTASTNWTFNAGTPSTSAFTLTVGSGAPSINVSNQIATIAASIYGTAGLTKDGGGTLRLNAANTNATGQLNGLIIVNQGILQAGNASCFGVAGNLSSLDRTICTNNGTIELISTIAPNNEHLTLAGTGNGGTNGALYANLPAAAGSTRWGLSIDNVNSAITHPAITLAGDTTIRVDGAAIGAFSNVFLAGYITTGTNQVVNFTNSFFTLTKTGTGRISLDRGLMVSNVVVQAGSVSPNIGGGFNGVQNWIVNSGGAILNWQNNCYSSAATMTVNSGGLWDINGRLDNAGAYTQNIGTIAGAGTICLGINSNSSVNTLSINSAVSNSYFSGNIIVSNGIFNLTKTGAGTSLTLAGTNTYNGTTTINAGSLVVDGWHTGGSNYVVNSGTILAGKGTIIPASTCSIMVNGTLVAGDNGGTLTVSNVAGGGDVYVTNAGLVVLGQLNSASSGYLNSLNLTNSVITAKLQQNGTDGSIYANNLNVDGTNNILSFTTANPAIGQYPFIKYGGINGLDGFAGLVLVPPAGVTAYLSNNTANSSVDIVVTGIPALVWRGTPTGDWSIGGSANWLNVATPAAYTETAGFGPFVIFDDTAAGSASVNLTTTVTPKGITVNSSSKNYTYTGSGLISGNGSWIKDGSSTLTLANTGTNTYNGTLTIANGAVSVGTGGTAGNLGGATVVNSGTLIFNRSDDVTVGNIISGTGGLVKQAAGKLTLTGVGNIGSAVTINAGTLALAPAGTITVSGDVTGGGAFGVSGSGTVILGSANITYSGGTVISNGTLELDTVFPPSGNIADNGTLALGTGGTLANNISGKGGLTLLNSSYVTLGGANTYTGPTVVLGGEVDAAAANYPAASVLKLGNLTGGAAIGNANFTAGDPVIAGLNAGGNSSSPVNTINLSAGNQTLTINGNLNIGNISPTAASVGLYFAGSGSSVVVNTNGGTIQIGLGTFGSGVNPDNVLVDLSQIDNFTANLGSTGLLNLGTLDGNPGPPAGATVVNQFKLAAVSNSITAGTITIGAGGRQLIPELHLGAGTNIINADTVRLGAGGRDGGYLLFDGPAGGVRVRAHDGVSRATMNVGVANTGTGAGITNTVDFTGHPVDLLFGSLVIGSLNNAGAYQCTFSFDTGVLDATNTSLAVLRNNNGNPGTAALNIGGGTASLGPVNLTASAGTGTLTINHAIVTVANITSPGTGTAELDINDSTLNLALASPGNPVTAPVVVDNFNPNGTVNLGFSGGGFVVGQFPLISYAGGIGGGGYSSLNLTSLPAGVTGYLSNNVASLTVDVVVTSAPPTVNTNPTNITATVSGGTLTLTWPADHAGWHLQAQTNSLATGLGTNWVTIPNSNLSNGYTNTLDSAKGAVFYRMVYP